MFEVQFEINRVPTGKVVNTESHCDMWISQGADLKTFGERETKTDRNSYKTTLIWIPIFSAS